MSPAGAGSPGPSGSVQIEPLGPGEPGRVGPYEILGRIGHGGQGRVYLGRRDGGPEVAVKVLGTTQSTHDTKARRRFAQELMAARRVPQACTAVVLDADLAGQQPYIVSEYVPGPSLQQAVDDGGVLAGAALERLATYTATALAAIHGARVVHRDFKPGNVLLGPDGPRVVDFGIAQALESTSVHTTGIIGTFHYMAPEQINKDSLGPAADVHAWAATMVFAATGRPPFGDGELAAVMFRILHQPPRLDGVAEPLRTLVARCLAKNPGHRPTALQALQFLIGQGTTSDPAFPGPGLPAVPPTGPGPAPGAPASPPGTYGPPGVHGPAPVDHSASPSPPPTKRLPDSSPGSTKRLPDSSPGSTKRLPDLSPGVTDRVPAPPRPSADGSPRRDPAGRSPEGDPVGGPPDAGSALLSPHAHPAIGPPPAPGDPYLPAGTRPPAERFPQADPVGRPPDADSAVSSPHAHRAIGFSPAAEDLARPPGAHPKPPASSPDTPSTADRSAPPQPGQPLVHPLYVTMGDLVHTLDGDQPYTIGGPGSTIPVPGLGVPGDLIYIRHRGVWRLNIRLPGADIRVTDARRDDRTVAFTDPTGHCVVRGEASGIRINCEISPAPPSPRPGLRYASHPTSTATRPRQPAWEGSVAADAGRPDHPTGPGREGVPSGSPTARPAAAGPVTAGGTAARHSIGDVTVLGSGTGADVVVPGIDVAAEHATLLRTTGGFRLRDHGRGGGTYVRGRSVLWASLGVGDDFAIGGTTFRLVSEDTLETRPEPRADLLVHELSARYGNLPALSELSFALGDGQFMAIVGPSGAGKSSLFRALLGELPITGGTLVFRGLNLVADAERIRHLLGYVPQQDHLHRSLTVRQNLRYAARLRLPADMPRRAREERVAEVCERLGLGDHLDARADTLSGGQRKRLSIALEILSEPLLLLLDEPTSGLDPGLDQEVMRLLREIADRGCSVIVVTHTPDNLGLADQVLVMGNGGRAAYVGPPDGILTALSARDFPELMRELAARPAVPEESGERSAPTAPQPIPVARPAPDPSAAAADDDTVRPRRAGAPAPRQFRVFADRQAALLRARGVVGLLMPFGLAVIGALIIAALAGANTEPVGLNRGQVLTTLVIVSALVGQALTYNNLVSEYEITAREYRTGLSPGALVLGKFVIFAVVALVQGLLVAVVYSAVRGSPAVGLLSVDPVVELAMPLSAVALASMALGLALSALAPTAEKAVGLVTVAAIVQVALNGFAFTLTGPLAAVGALVPSRWGVAVGAASQNLRTPVRDDPLWTHTTGQFAFDLAMLVVLTVAFVATAWLILRRRLSRAA